MAGTRPAHHHSHLRKRRRRRGEGFSQANGALSHSRSVVGALRQDRDLRRATSGTQRPCIWVYISYRLSSLKNELPHGRDKKALNLVDEFGGAGFMTFALTRSSSWPAKLDGSFSNKNRFLPLLHRGMPNPVCCHYRPGPGIQRRLCYVVQGLEHIDVAANEAVMDELRGARLCRSAGAYPQ